MPTLTGFTRYKGVTVTIPSTYQFGDWVQVHLTDPTMTALPTSDNDLAVTVQATGERLPVSVLSRSTSVVVLAIGLPGISVAGDSYALWVWVSNGAAAAWTPTTWGSVPDITGLTGTLGPSLTLKDGVGGTLASNRWVHPQVMRVDHLTGTQAWLGYATAAERALGIRTVTHWRIDTPYPSGDQKWENPYLLISKDNGATWEEPNASLNPIVPQWPNPLVQFNSDVGFCLRADGTLYCVSRYDDGASAIMRTLVLGTCAEDAVVTSAAAALTGPTGIPIAPSLAAVSSTEWYLFYIQNSTNSRPLMRCTSTDEGVTWSAPAVAFCSQAYSTDPTAANADILRRPWHQGMSAGPIGGYWYLYCSETSDAATTTNTNLSGRVYRTTDPGPNGRWEPMRTLVLQPTVGTFCSDGLYMGNVFQKTDGSLALFVSGTTAGAGAMNVQRLSFDPTGTVTLASVHDAMSWGTGDAMKYATVGTTRLHYDLAEGPSSGLANLAGGAALSVVDGTPVYTAGVGYTFAGTSRLTTGFDLQDAGGADTPDPRWLLEVEFTVTAAEATAANTVMPLWGATGTGPITAIRSEVVGNAAGDWLRTQVAWADATASENTSTQWTTTALPGGWSSTKHTLRLVYTGATLRFFLDGREFYTVNKNTGGSPTLLRDVSNAMYLGGVPVLVTGSAFGRGTIHKWRYAAMPSTYRFSDDRAPVAVWDVGSTLAPVSAPSLLLTMRGNLGASC